MLSDKIIAPPVDAAMMEHDTEEDRRGEDVLAYDPENGAEESKMIAQEQGRFKLNAPEMYPGNYELIDELAASSPVSNVSFVYVVYPKLTDVSGTLNYPNEIVTPRGHLVPIIDLARPDRFPSFYETKFWHDEAHLDEQGAAQVSEVFAQQLMAWYAAHGAPQRCGGSRCSLSNHASSCSSLSSCRLLALRSNDLRKWFILSRAITSTVPGTGALR